VSSALQRFVGEILQTPPAYSAIKVAGKPLYRYAREGTAITAAARTVRIESIDVLRFDVDRPSPAVEGDAPRLASPTAEIEVVCGKGTYIRSLAHDLGQRLGCGALLAALRRTSSGGFGIDDAHTPDELTAAAGDGSLTELMLAVDRAVERRPAAILANASASDVRSGRDLRLDGVDWPEICRAYSVEGDFLGVLRTCGEGSWHPEKVVPAA
jgi:tRNA pseudouridine55 synthase